MEFIRLQSNEEMKTAERNPYENRQENMITEYGHSDQSSGSEACPGIMAWIFQLHRGAK